MPSLCEDLNQLLRYPASGHPAREPAPPSSSPSSSSWTVLGEGKWLRKPRTV